MTTIWSSGATSVTTASDEYRWAKRHHFSLFTKYSHLQGTEGNKRPYWPWVALQGIPTRSVPLGPGAPFTSSTKTRYRCTCLLTPFSPDWTSVGSPSPSHVGCPCYVGGLGWTLLPAPSSASCARTLYDFARLVGALPILVPPLAPISPSFSKQAALTAPWHKYFFDSNDCC